MLHVDLNTCLVFKKEKKLTRYKHTSLFPIITCCQDCNSLLLYSIKHQEIVMSLYHSFLKEFSLFFHSVPESWQKTFSTFLCHGRNALHQNVNTRVVVREEHPGFNLPI